MGVEMITILTNIICTAYIWTGSPCANGHWPKVGYTCATSDRTIPFGSTVEIDGRVWTVEDRTNKRFDIPGKQRIDLFLSSKKNALRWGKQNKSVKLTVKQNNKK